jgi:hypothetical protein
MVAKKATTQVAAGAKRLIRRSVGWLLTHARNSTLEPKTHADLNPPQRARRCRREIDPYFVAAS